MMNADEAQRLLTLASARDGRIVDRPTAIVWSQDLCDVDYDEAVEAAREHYRRSDRWLMPAHVVQLVEARRQSIPGGHTHRWVVDGSCVDPHCTAVRP